MEADRIKWNQRFASEEAFLGLRASPFLTREIELIKRISPGRRALDIACGEGRNSIFLAQHGFNVTGVDIADVGIGKAKLRAEQAGAEVAFHLADLEEYHFDESFDLIINFNFLLRNLIPEAYSALSTGGIFVLDTIMESPEVIACHTPDYLLKRGELKDIFSALEGDILFIEELVEGTMPTARVLFRKNR